MTGGEPREATGHLWIVGPGRVGLSLGGALLAAGALSRLSFSGRHAASPPHSLFSSDRVGYAAPAQVARSRPTAILLAVRDAEIADVAADLARLALPGDVPVLHTSGALGREVLAPLAEGGHPTGSLHPLVSLPDPEEGARRLKGAWFAVEGDAPAISLAERFVQALAGHLLRVSPQGKPLYHAAAVFASNYLTTLLAVAEQLFTEAGVEAGAAREAAAALAGGAVENARALGPAAALTGPVARGDVETVRLHLQRLSPPERALYSVLARRTRQLARQAGLPGGSAETLATLLEEEV